MQEQATLKEAKRFCAVIEYDGTNYCGFQRQVVEQVTIQGELEKAIEKISCQSVNVAGSGRTDSGVHAKGQVISFDLVWQHGAIALLRAINSVLPPDIVVRELDIAESDFHARHSAKLRRYRYTIYHGEVRSPLMRLSSWHVPYPLLIEPMQKSADQLIGTHDFATFGQPSHGVNCVRTVYQAVWQWHGNLLTFDIEANAFLKRMVRSIVGSLKLVGEGVWSEAEFLSAFKAADRQKSGPSAPPQGLSLESVSY